MFDQYIALIKQGFKDELPGQDAQSLMLPAGRPQTNLNKLDQYNPRKAGVLVLLYPVKNVPHVVFILRNTYPGVHSNQVGFPGGKVEEEDEDIIATALRESFEELAILPDSVSVLGKLTSVYIPPSNFVVQPIVGFTQNRPKFIPDDIEVSEIMEVPLEHFFDLNNIKTHEIEVRGTRLKTPSYIVNERIIWGATAMMLSEFLTLVQRQSKK